MVVSESMLCRRDSHRRETETAFVSYGMGLTFQLKAAHVAALSPCERSAYRSLIGSAATEVQRRHEFLARSEDYRQDDERLLPYPERSSRGIMLTSLSQSLAGSESALVLECLNPRMRPFIQKKLRNTMAPEGNAQKTLVYSVKGQEFFAALMCRGGNPFDIFRQRDGSIAYRLPSLPRRLVCVVDPLESICQSTDEYRVAGMFVRYPSPRADERLKQAAHMALTKVTPLDHGVWVVPSK